MNDNLVMQSAKSRLRDTPQNKSQLPSTNALQGKEKPID